MSPEARRRGALILLALSIVIGWPVSWFLPKIDPLLSQQVLMWVSFLAITLTCADVAATTDVRAEGAGSDK